MGKGNRNKRGQMFVVTTVFLVGLVFAVQQILFQYASVNPREGFQINEYGMVKSLRDCAAAALDNSNDCGTLSSNMDILKSFVDKSSASSGYTMEFSYSIDCDSWNNRPPSDPPLNVSIRVLGSSIDSTSSFVFYKS